jgi:hypothetical protein
MLNAHLGYQMEMTVGLTVEMPLAEKLLHVTTVYRRR